MVGDNACHKSQAVSLGRANLVAGQDQMRSSSHPDKVWQGDQRHRRKTTELDFGLAELGGFSGKNEIAKCGQLHAAAKAVSMDSSDLHAIRFGQTAKNTMKRRQHFFDAFGCVVGDIHTRGEGPKTCTPKDQEIAMG
jgi:hypothetical protein